MDERAELLKTSGLTVRFFQAQGLRRTTVVPVNQVSLSIGAGEILGLVGESGSGKTTLGRTLAGMIVASQGRLWFNGRDVTRLGRRALRQYWTEVQMIFQDVYNALNPVYTVEQQLSFPISRHAVGKDPDQELERLLHLTGLTPSSLIRRRLPHELSGGQRQRVAIVRALASRPRLLVADEPVSMLDVSLRAEILQLLADLRQALGLSLVYITHDLPSAIAICDRIIVMYGGRLIESAPAGDLVKTARHPYTARLLLAATFDAMSAESRPKPDRQASGSILQPSYRGCPYAPRCPAVTDICVETVPDWIHVDDGHVVACHAVASGRLGAGLPAREKSPG